MSKLWAPNCKAWPGICSCFLTTWTLLLPEPGSLRNCQRLICCTAGLTPILFRRTALGGPGQLLDSLSVNTPAACLSCQEVWRQREATDLANTPAFEYISYLTRHKKSACFLPDYESWAEVIGRRSSFVPSTAWYSVAAKGR
jgi:hypothetical protein